MGVFVSAEWVEANADRIRLVDVRDAWEYDEIGHIPGAVNIPFDVFRSEEGDEGMLPGVETWTGLMSEAGVAPEDILVAYDDTQGVFAARFLVTAELYGHDSDRLRLLDGDYSAWSRERGVSRGRPSIDPGDYVADRSSDSPLVGYEAVVESIDSERIILDTREPWEYEEGHLPGAIQLDWREFVDTDSRGLKPRDELEKILANHGVTAETPVLLYCNTARRISHTYLVLRHLGYDDLWFYEGSLTEWKSVGGPLETEAPGE